MIVLTFATIIQERLKRLEADKAELKAIVEKVRGWNLDCCTSFVLKVGDRVELVRL